MGSGASTGLVNNGLTNTNPSYAVKIQLVSTAVQTDPWQPEVKAVEPEEVSENTAVIDLATAAALDTGMHHGMINQKTKKTPEETWLEVCETLDVPKGKKYNVNALIQKRTGWKTVRIFVSSTFRDFMPEREILVKQVFPDLREWCEQRRLHLVDCDLRWGVPKDTTTESTLRMCLGEIDRCYQDNIMPYFLNMTSERIGWIPLPQEVPPNLVDEYRWIFGLSVTEMEIVHGAYRKDNPNSLFLWRNDSFLKQVPESSRQTFVDENPIAPTKLKLLRKMIEERFPPTRVMNYDCEYDGEDENGKVQLKLEDTFKERVFNFFKERIEIQYPLVEKDPDPFNLKTESHESFLKAKAESVLGRSNVIKQITDYVVGGGGDVPLLLLGGPGTGKSSIMARAADEVYTKVLQQQLPPPPGPHKKWHMFFHFVGAVPGSTELLMLIQRLLKQVGVQTVDLPIDLESAVQSCCSTLNNQGTEPVIIFIDALNQLDEDLEAKLMNWIPRKLAPQVRCVFAMIQDTPQHKSLISRESKPKEINVKPLDLSVRKDMVAELLGKFNKKLDMDQMISLLTKKSSENPLWLSIACEELRVFGYFRQISDKINSLSDGLLELLQQVLARFEQEGAETRDCLVACMCLLEVSSNGLLESELLEILADEDNLMPPSSDGGKEKGEKEKSEKERGFKPAGHLPPYKWAAVYRSLRTFLRPFGDSGEGRLDFYHRSLSKAVRIKYLKKKDDDESAELNDNYKWWHKKLADYFDYSQIFDRKVEEYPYHLIKLNDMKRLEAFLSHWKVFDILFDSEFSGKFIKYWNHCGGKDRIIENYSEKLQELKKQGDKDVLAQRYEHVGRLLVQAGEYDQPLNLANEALKLEEEELGKRPERMASIYCLLTMVWDQKVKLHEFCSVSQIPEIKTALSFNETALDYLKQMPPTRENKRTMGMFLVKKAFNLANFADCHGDAEMSVEEALKKGENLMVEAIKLFEEINDIGHKAEAVMTKAVLCRYNHSKQVKLYQEALDLCKQAYGEFSILTGRIHMNWGIVYEDAGQYETSYRYFKKNYMIQLEVVGPDHVRAVRAKKILQEPMYTRIAQRLGETVPVDPVEQQREA